VGNDGFNWPLFEGNTASGMKFKKTVDMVA